MTHDQKLCLKDLVCRIENLICNITLKLFSNVTITPTCRHHACLPAGRFADIVGFTALMGSDEKKTFDILEKNRQIHKPIIDSYNGRWIKELGDGVMASFGNVSDAVNAAIKIMEACNAAVFP